MSFFDSMTTIANLIRNTLGLEGKMGAARMAETLPEALDAEYNNGYSAGHTDGYDNGVEEGKELGRGERNAIMFGILSRDLEVIEKEHLNGLTYIGGYAFYNYSKLKSVELPESVTLIKGAAFQNCTALTSVELPEASNDIAASVFQGCTGLTELVIPANVRTLGGYALRIGSADNKATITMMGTTPPTVANTTFASSNLDKIIVPVGCSEAYKTATNWSAFADYIEEATT